MKRLLAVLVLAVLAAVLTSTPAFPQAQPGQTNPLVSAYNVASTSYIYCITLDNAGRFWSTGNQGLGKVTTSGSSTTVTAVTAADDPFASVAAGDELSINLDGVIERRYVATKVSADEITVNAAIDLSVGRQGAAGYSFFYRTLSCSTGATAGWIPVRGLSSATYSIAVETINATSLDFALYCRHNGSNSVPVEVWSKSYTAAGGDFVTLVGSAKDGLKYDACRMGVKVNTDAGTQSLTMQVGG